MFKKPHTKRVSLLLSFLVPMILMTAYFAYRKMAPFGSSSILTVDLGQQYVDFFAFFRHSILHHPSSFFYSFSKGLGGEMWGTSAYYLFSPLNLILLPFAGKSLSTGILLLVLLKYGLAGLSMNWLILKEKLQPDMRSWAFSTAYALMGWMIANQLNILWLDVLILLPLVIYGLLKISRREAGWTYIGWLTVMMMDNYYMAWMVCLFVILFFLWQFSRSHHSLSSSMQLWGRFIISSVTSALLAAVVLLPTIYALLQSKATYSENNFKFKFEYQPWKLLAKLVPGSFNFNQIPSGQANIYVGMLILIGAILYFSNRHERWQARLAAGCITIFLILSFCVSAFDLIWHLGQYPVWYPSRFSFVWSFWLIWLAANTLTPEFHLGHLGGLLLTLASLGVAIFLFLQKSHISYISSSQIIVGLIFCWIAIALLTLDEQTVPALTTILFCFLIVCDIATNAYTSLNQISYVPQQQFGAYTQALNQASLKVKKSDHGLYRVSKDFMRTKDDPLQSDFYSGDHFGSTLEPGESSFMGDIGQPAGDGFVTYMNGTKLTDALLGFKYSLSARNDGIVNDSQVLPLTANRPDWHSQNLLSKTKSITIRKNPNALPLAFSASADILNFKSLTLDPLAYQSQIFRCLAGQGADASLFSVQNFNHVTFHNVNSAQQITGSTFKKKNAHQPASITLHFTPTTNEAYYLTLGDSVKSAVHVSLNGRPLNQYPTYRNTIVINVANHDRGRHINIKFDLKKQTAWLQNVSLYKLNEKPLDHDIRLLRSGSVHWQHVGANRMTGSVNIKKNKQVVMTTIPYNPGWKVTVDGHPIKSLKAVNYFMAIPITPGHHTISFRFVPPLLKLGAILSLVTLAGVIFIYWKRRQ